MAVNVINNLSAREILAKQPVEIFSGLANSIALANALKATLNAHYADAGSSGEEHLVADTSVSVSNAVDLVGLIALVSAIQDSYVAHENDAVLATPVLHQAQTSDDDSLTSETNPTTLSGCVTVLNDIKAKLNLHMADSTAHSAGDSTSESTADATESFEITDSFQDISGVINVKGVKSIVLWIRYDKGTSTDMSIQALVGPDKDNCDYEFVIETVSASKVDLQDEDIEVADADLNFVRQFVLDGSINFIKFQCKDSADGTGQIDKAMVSIGR